MGGLVGLVLLAAIVAVSAAYGRRKPPARPTLQDLIKTVWYDPNTHQWHRKDTK